jgi:hypothetical protein
MQSSQGLLQDKIMTQVMPYTKFAGFFAREDYDTGNAIYKVCSSPSPWTLYSFIVFVPVNNFKNGCSHWFHWRTEFDILIFFYYSWYLAIMCHISSRLLSKFRWFYDISYENWKLKGDQFTVFVFFIQSGYKI